MCCFSRPVLSVGDTAIFARLSGNGFQHLVYQMKYATKEPNAMILPLPVATPASEESIEFVDLSNYNTFFEDCNRAFPELPEPMTDRAGESAADAGDWTELAVHNVGSFITSFVPTVGDFHRLDERFVIPKETWAKIPEYADYGFAVFQLDDLAGKPHPMAIRFKSRLKKLFFPTVHIHDGEVHSREEFDHDLFMQHAGLDSVVGNYKGPRQRDFRTNLVRSKRVASKYCDIQKAKGLIAPGLLIHRAKLAGKLPNRDTFFSPTGSPTIPSINFRHLIHWWPLALVFGSVLWLVRRRNRLRPNECRS